RVGRLELGPYRGSQRREDVLLAIVELARAYRRGELRLVGDTELGQRVSVDGGVALAEGKLAADDPERSQADAQLERRAALQQGEDLLAERAANRLDQLARAGTVVQAGGRPVAAGPLAPVPLAAGLLAAPGRRRRWPAIVRVQELQEIPLHLARPPADDRVLDRARGAGEVGEGLHHAEDPPAERARGLPPVQRPGIPVHVAGALVASPQ